MNLLMLDAAKYIRFDSITDLVLAALILGTSIVGVIKFCDWLDYSAAINHADEREGLKVASLVLLFIVSVACLWVMNRAVPRVIYPQGYLTIKKDLLK